MVYKVIGNITLVDALSHIYKGEIIDPLVNRFYKGTSVLQGQRLVESCKSPCKSVYKGNDTNHLVNRGFCKRFYKGGGDPRPCKRRLQGASR